MYLLGVKMTPQNNFKASLMKQAIIHFQTIGIFGSLKLGWPDTLLGFIDFSKSVSLTDSDIFSITCFWNHGSLSIDLIYAGFLCVFFFYIVMLLVLILILAIGKLRKKVRKE